MPKGIRPITVLTPEEKKRWKSQLEIEKKFYRRRLKTQYGIEFDSLDPVYQAAFDSLAIANLHVAKTHILNIEAALVAQLCRP